MWEKVIKMTEPYHFEGVLQRLMIDPLQQIDKKTKTIIVPMYIKNKPTVITLQGIGTIKHPVFLIKGKQKSDEKAVLKRLAEIFHWNHSLTEIHHHFLGTDLKKVFEEHRGTPLILDYDPYSCLLKCIIHQQLNMSFAHTLSKRFVQSFGFQQEGAWFYPEPEKVASLKIEQLRDLQFSSRKAEYVIGVAELVKRGKLDFTNMAMMSDEKVYAELIKIRGIGPWTIENFLMFALGRPNLFPKRDIGLQNAIKKLYKLDRKPTIKEMERYSRAWKPYLSYASLYLWRSIE